MILVISGGRQNFFASFSVSGQKKRGSKKKTSEKTCFWTKMTQIWPIVKFLHFVFFSHKTKKTVVANAFKELLKNFWVKFAYFEPQLILLCITCKIAN